MSLRTSRTILHDNISETNLSTDRSRSKHSREIKALPISKGPNHLPQYYFGPNTITQPSTFRESLSQTRTAGASQLTARPSRERVPHQNYSVSGVGAGYMNSSRSHSSIENEDSSNLAIREISHGSVFNTSRMSARDGQSTHRPSKSIDYAIPTESTARGGNTGRSSVTEIAEKYKALLKAYEKLVKINFQAKEELEKEKEGAREQKIYVKQLKEILEESIAKAGLTAYFKEGIEKIQGEKSGQNNMSQYFFDVVNLQKMLAQVKQENRELIKLVDVSKRELEEKGKDIDMLNNRLREEQDINEKLRGEGRNVHSALEMAKQDKKEAEREKELMLNAFKTLKENSVTRNEYINISSQYNNLKKQYEQLENDYKELKKLTLRNNKGQIQELSKAENKENLPNNVTMPRDTFNDGKKLPTQPLRLKGLDKDTGNQEKLFAWNQGSPLKQKISDEALASVGWSHHSQDRENIEDSQLKAQESQQIRGFGETKQSIDIQYEALQNKVATVVEYLHTIRLEIFEIVNENMIADECEENKEVNQNIIAIRADFEATLGSLRLLRDRMNEMSDKYEETKRELVREQKKNQRLQLEKIEKQKEDLHFEDYEKIKVKLEQIHRDAALRAKEREFLEKTVREEREMSHLAIMCLQKFIYNEEIAHCVKKFLNIHERRKKVQRKIFARCKETQKSAENKASEQHSDVAKELQDELKRLSKLENDILKELNELEKQEKRRYESLYLLEKQNSRLKNEVIKRKETREDTQEDHMSHQMSTMKQSTLSRLLEDVRMPMTRINFDFDGSEKFSRCETELGPSRDSIDH